MDKSQNAVQLFNHEQFGEIRTAGTWDNPLFCLADVCRALDLRVDGVVARLSKDPITILGSFPNTRFKLQVVFNKCTL